MAKDRNGLWVAVWIGIGLAFGLWILAAHGSSAATEYYAAYFLEESLSVDNIFVFIIIFSELHIPVEYQQRVLWFGIIGALVFRGLMVVAGIALIQRFEWIMYPFVALILFAAWRMVFGAERERKVVHGACDVCETWIARVVPVSPVMQGGAFWRRDQGRLVATPLLVALVVIETTDLVFALDSVPAVLAVSRNPLIVYSSNVLAVLGLRSLYFVLADALHQLRYLRPGLALILVFTAVKMLTAPWFHISAGQSVAVIGFILMVTIGASLWSRAEPR